MGQGATQETHEQSRQRMTCGKREEWANQYLRCSQCHITHYCSNMCQRKHWSKNTVLCEAIRDVKKEERHPQTDDRELKRSFPSHLTPRQHTELTRLVGRRSVISCPLQGKKVDAQWDTGAQVCVISKHWKEDSFTRRDSKRHKRDTGGRRTEHLSCKRHGNVI